MGRNKVNDNSIKKTNNGMFEYSKVNGCCDEDLPSKPRSVTRKNQLSKTIVDEFNNIQQLFDVLDIADLNNGRKGVVDEDDDDDEDLQLPDIPEKKVFKKTPSKKGPAQSAAKNKSFPQSVEELEKELEEIKGTPMTYQKQIRKKGLQTRLTKKKRKENLKQSKAILKQGKKLSGAGKLIKPVLNSDGNVVSNKFDFADNEIKKETKRKHTTSISECKDENQPNKKLKSSVHNNKQQIKTEHNDVGGSNKILIEDSKPKLNSGPLFNKDNKMVFSKILVSDKKFSRKKKKPEKDPKKILQKIKDDSKKITELEKQDIEKALNLKEKQKWSTALKRASGEKVKDDPDLLKKSILKEKNKKMKSKKKWDARIDRVQQDKDERQKKRKDNIQARIQENKKRKMKRAVKKGRFIQV